MQGISHRVFNTVLAGDLLVCCYDKFPLMTSIMAGGMIVFSGFPDKIERLGLKHRGISHSVIVYALLGWMYFWWSTIFNQYFDWISYIGYGFVCGCLGHILADMFSKNGVSILGAKFNFKLYSTGKVSEQIFLFGFVLLNFLLMYWFVFYK
jgi:membrane-bound metal-dependent hydrolase YbcI (DUF457 family)